MPNLPAYLCPAAGCYERVTTPEARCAAHRPTRKAYDQQRGSPASRGYDAAWKQYRLRRLAQQPLCEDCLDAGGTLTPSREVHHLIKVRDRPDLRLVDSNTRCLCSPCHARRTLRGE